MDVSTLRNILILCCLFCGVKSINRTCPDPSQWNLKAKSMCDTARPEYYCLADVNKHTFREFCEKVAEFQRPGYKFIIQGALNAMPCNINRFQPFKFWTNGSSECVFLKSTCNEEGQVVFNEGNPTTDRTCKCDYTKGYNFVNKPKDECHCNPTVEDCSCVLVRCGNLKVLTPDYKCIHKMNWTGKFKCDVIENPRRTTVSETTATPCPTVIIKEKTQNGKIQRQAAIAVTIMTLPIAMIIFVMTGRLFGFNYLRHLDDRINHKVEKRMTEHLDDRINEKVEERIKEMDRIKSKIRINYKDIVTTIRHEKIVDQLISEEILLLADRKVIDDCLRRSKKNTKLLEIVINKGLYACKAFLQILQSGGDYKDLAMKINNTNDNIDCELEMFSKLEDTHNENIPKETRDLHERYLQRWHNEDKRFVETSLSIMINQHLQNSDIVLIVGQSGNGKSAIARHIALHFLNFEDFDVIPIAIEPITITKYNDPLRKQVFVIDDFCGKEDINTELEEEWSTSITDIIRTTSKGTTKLIFSCSLRVFNETVSNNFPVFKGNIFALNEHSLTDVERNAMIKMYHFSLEDSKRTINKDFPFPLLCKLCEGKNPEEINKFFRNPYESVQDDLTKIEQNDTILFFLMTVCALFGNCFDLNWLDNKSKIENDTKNKGSFNFISHKEMKGALSVLRPDFGLDLDKESTKNRVRDAISTIKTIFLTKEDDQIHFVHDKIYEIVSVVCGKRFFYCFVIYAPRSFICNKYLFCSVKGEMKDYLINVEKGQEKYYFDRIISDLEKGDTYTAFRNSQLKYEEYRSSFCAYCKTRKGKIVDILKNFKDRTSANKIDANKAKIVKNDPFFTHGLQKGYFIKTNVPLIESAWIGYRDIVEMLINMDCYIDETDELLRTPLFVASQKGHLNVVKLLLKNKAKMTCDNEGRSPLCIACEEGTTDVVKVLLEAGADVNVFDTQGNSPLHKACSRGHKQITQILLKESADVSKQNRGGQTPFLLASMRNRRHVVEVLLDYIKGHESSIEKSKTINVCDNDESSPLYIACKKGYLEIVNLLLENNADPTRCNWHGKSPLYAACAEGHTKIVRALLSSENASSLLEQHTDRDETPLWRACEHGKKEIVRLLMKKGAKYDICDNQQRTPFYVACKNGRLDLIKLFCDIIPNINEFINNNQWESSPLCVSCREGQKDIAEHLLIKGADVNKCDSNGKSALFVACEEGHYDIVHLLIKYNATCDLSKESWQLLVDTARKHGHHDIVKKLINCDAQSERDEVGQSLTDDADFI